MFPYRLSTRHKKEERSFRWSSSCCPSSCSRFARRRSWRGPRRRWCGRYRTLAASPPPSGARSRHEAWPALDTGTAARGSAPPGHK